MNFKLPIAVAALAACSLVATAQTASAPANGAKKPLVAKILQLQQGAIEGFARLIVEQPAMQLMQQAAPVLQQRIAPDRREAIGQDIQADVRKYVEDTLPTIRERALKLAPAAIGPLLEERFTADELRQIIAFIESPVNRKYQAMGNELQRALGEKLAPEVRGQLDANVRALQQSMATRLGVAPAAPASGASR